MARWSRLPALLLLTGSGCALRDYIWEPPVRPADVDAAIARVGFNSATPSELSPELAAAHEKFKAGDYAKAQKAYHKIADNMKNPPPVAEEARYFEAECLYQQDEWPKACDTYNKMLLDFASGTYRAKACRRMFDIANSWCDDIRAEMELDREKRDGKRWMVITPVVHFEKKKPFLDLEGRALQALENVHLNDIGGPLADKALFMAGGIKFYREDYKEADYYFTQIVEQHPNSALAPRAIELAIIAKHLSTGGSDYDGRKVAEARQLVDTALRAYPELAAQKGAFLERQLSSINFQQAEKDFNTAEFYRRTNHPGAAYYYYEIVRRSYPETRFAADATKRMMDVRKDVESGKYSPTESDVFRSLQNQVEGLFGAKPKADEAPQAPGPTMLPAPKLLPEGGATLMRLSRASQVIRRAAYAVPFLVCAALTSCESGGHFTILGYSSRPNYDPCIKTIYVPIFENKTFWRGLEFDLTKAVIREIEAKTPFKVVNDRARADTILTGSIGSFQKMVINRNQLNEIREAETVLTAAVVWQDLRSGEVLSQPKPKPTGPVFAPLPEIGSGGTPDAPPNSPARPVMVTSLGNYIPEIGQSTTTAIQQNVNRLAVQIVSVMEKPW